MQKLVNSSHIFTTQNGVEVFVGGIEDIENGCFNVVVNCTNDIDLKHAEMSYGLKIPISFGVPTSKNIKSLRIGLRKLLRRLQRGIRVLIHCRYGKHRSSHVARSLCMLVSDRDQD